jgi:hypothetical protein
MPRNDDAVYEYILNKLSESDSDVFSNTDELREALLNSRKMINNYTGNLPPVRVDTVDSISEMVDVSPNAMPRGVTRPSYVERGHSAHQMLHFTPEMLQEARERWSEYLVDLPVTITPSTSNDEDVFFDIDECVSEPVEPQEEDDIFLELGSYYASYKEPRRSEKSMLMELITSDIFPRPNFVDCSNEDQRSEAIDDWYRNVEYKDNWIFSRREREGFNRRNIGHFSLDDVMSRISKRRNKHQLDNEHSTFYDWKLGGTDWILRLELFQYEEKTFLISRYIYKPNNTEMKFDVKLWSGSQFKVLYSMWCEHKNNDTLFNRVVESNRYHYDYEHYEDSYTDDYDGDED